MHTNKSPTAQEYKMLEDAGQLKEAYSPDISLL
ncbi:hypothetical protein HDF23_004795 [Mucilaginibacter lappiensis]|uniref:Uncharacterized protein n=1 Tax=Mucilaginibacter lappiensis TaxID=354630 RepID=A0ABR6PQG3_9SPHI|nr:hypothetical protein [Mucilaginibacter lappiensis]